MARTLALCLAYFCFPALARAEHAPPPPIVLARAPAPELPALEYARHPFEISAALELAFPSCDDGSSTSERCTGVSRGLGFGVSALWRPTPYFAFGAAFDRLGFAFQPRSSDLRDGSAAGHFIGLLGRLYFFDHGWLEPYLELGLGSGGVSTSAREASVEYQESAAGMALRAGGGLAFYVGRHVRLEPAFDFTRVSVGQVRRCGASRCAELDEAAYGHGTGFSSLSLRLSVVLGPAL